MKRIYFCFILVFCAVILQAQELLPCLTVEMKTGEKYEFFIKEKPKMKYDGNKVTLYYADTSMEYDVRNVKKLFFNKASQTAIDNIIISDSKLTIDNQILHITELGGNEPVSLYSVTGQLFFSMKADAFGVLNIAYSTLPKGNFIIKTKYHSFKIVRR